MSEIPDYIGNFQVVKELGRGSMGTVYLGHQESLGRDLAIKVLAPEFTRDPEFVERFRREGRVAASLRHPNIVRIYDADCRDGQYFIAMEYSGDSDLRDLLNREGKLSIQQSIFIADRILAALHHAHQKGVVHRDVKPANVLMGGPGEVMLTDFSIARLAAADRLTRTGMVLGTPDYMCPEQFDSADIDGRADLYAAGLIILEMLTGQQPFKATTVPEVMKKHLMMAPPDPCQLNPEIPRGLGDFILKSLEKDPDKRFQDAETMRLAMLHSVGEDGAPDEDHLQAFLRSVETGSVSMDDAIRAKDLVKQAIDKGYKKVLTVLMVDLAGSSAIKKPDQTLMADRAFRDYRATINEIIKARGCERYDWSGDGAICLFDDADAAVEAAYEIQQQIEAVGSRHPDLPGQLKARIGVNTGEVYMDPRRSLGEFASRTVDQAGHLEKDCPVGEIRVSEATMSSHAHLFSFKSIGVNRDDVQVFEVTGRAKPGQTPAPEPRKKPVPKPQPKPQPQPAQSKERAPVTQQMSDSGQFWWGWPVGGCAVLMCVFGMILASFGKPNLGQVFASVGFLALIGLGVSCPILAVKYFRQGRKSAGHQSLGGCVAVLISFIFLVVVGEALKNLGL